MKPILIATFALVFIVSCASKKENSADAEKNLNTKYEGQVGSATKAQLMEHFGTAEWCKQHDDGGETCRFHKKTGTKWVGEKRDKKHYTQFDQIIAEFDSSGVLKGFKSSAQR